MRERSCARLAPGSPAAIAGQYAFSETAGAWDGLTALVLVLSTATGRAERSAVPATASAIGHDASLGVG